MEYSEFIHKMLFNLYEWWERGQYFSRLSSSFNPSDGSNRQMGSKSRQSQIAQASACALVKLV